MMLTTLLMSLFLLFVRNFAYIDFEKFAVEREVRNLNKSYYIILYTSFSIKSTVQFNVVLIVCNLSQLKTEMSNEAYQHYQHNCIVKGHNELDN